MASISRNRSLSYLQLDFFKLREYCIEQGLIKRTRRLTPVGEATKHTPLNIGAAEDISFRLFGQVVRDLFDGCQVVKQRNMAEFLVKLPDGEWYKGTHNENTREQFHPSLLPSTLPDNLGRFLSLKMWGPWNGPQTPRLVIGIDGRADASRYHNRRREDTLLKNGRPVTDFHSAMRAVVEWKRLMDARLEAVRVATVETETPPPADGEEQPEDVSRDTTAQAAFEEAARRMTNERQQNAD